MRQGKPKLSLKLQPHVYSQNSVSDISFFSSSSIILYPGIPQCVLRGIIKGNRSKAVRYLL